MAFRTSVQPPLEFIPPKFNRWVMRLSYWALPLLLNIRLRPWLPAGIRRVTVNNGDTLAHLFHQFQARKIRLLIAFRHVEVDDPLCMGHMFSHVVPQAAKQQHLELKGPIHSHFMYDRGMSLWAGSWLKGFFAWMGGIPVRRGAMDLKAIKTARDILINSQFPLTIAPEGATNGHSDILSPLEPGVAQLAFWGVQDLQRQQREEEVMVLPVSIRYRYIKPNWAKLDRLLAELETDSGLTIQSQKLSSNTPPNVDQYYRRLLRIGTTMLSYTEQIYRQFYHAPLAEPIGVLKEPGEAKEYSTRELGEGEFGEGELGEGEFGERAFGENEAIALHLQPLLDEMLKVGERYFDLSSKGDLPTRCRRLEEAGWTRIYREDLGTGKTRGKPEEPNVQGISAMEQGFADRLAAESQLQMEHMRLVESMVAVTGHYVKDNPSFERFAETTLLLFDVMQRIKGITVPCRPRLGWRQACITVGMPLSATHRWPEYVKNRKAGKDALTADIRQALKQLMTANE